MEKKSYVGYHGTSEKAAEYIIREDFRPTIEGWFGTGVYFYLDNIDLAKDWIKKKKFNNKKIIEALIEVEERFILDVRDPNNQDSLFFHKMRKMIKENIIKKKMELKTSTKNLDSVVFDLIIKKKNKKLIIGNSFTYDNDKTPCYSRIANGTELCVSDLEIIRKKEVIGYDE